VSKKKRFEWRVKHWYLIAGFMFLLTFVYRFFSNSVRWFDLTYLFGFAILNWLSIKHLLRYRRYRMCDYAKVVQDEW